MKKTAVMSVEEMKDLQSRFNEMRRENEMLSINLKESQALNESMLRALEAYSGVFAEIEKAGQGDHFKIDLSEIYRAMSRFSILRNQVLSHAKKRKFVPWCEAEVSLLQRSRFNGKSDKRGLGKNE